MFKISEVAGKLNVETYVIFEKLLTHAELLGPYTQKVHSISYIDEQGVEVLRALIEGKPVEEILDNQDPEETVLIEETVSVEKNIPPEEPTLDSTQVFNDPEDEDWLTEEDLRAINQEKVRLRQEVSLLRQEMIQHDSELKRLDDALLNYQILMREDVDYLMTLEERLEEKLLRKIISKDDKETNTGMFKFIKR